MQRFVRWVLAPLARLIFRPTVSGTHRIPRRGAVILAANHRAAVDTAAIALTAGRCRSWAMPSTSPGTGCADGRWRAFLRALGYVPVDRGNAKAGLAALQAARTVLDAGGAFAIYPEGTRSLDGRLHRGHTGVRRSRWPRGRSVVPVALVGTERVQPVGARFPGCTGSPCGTASRSSSPATKGSAAPP